MSRRHARVTVNETGTLIQDLGSKNGTFIDGQQLAAIPAVLRDGSRIAFGSVLVTYRESGGGMPTLTHFRGE